MNDLVVHIFKESSADVKPVLQSILVRYNIPNHKVYSFEDELYLNYYIEIDQSKAEGLIKDLTELEHVDGVYLKPKGSPPQDD